MSETCPLAVDIDFDNLTLLKAACRDWAIKKTFEFKTVRATKTYYEIVCKEEECVWCLYARSIGEVDDNLEEIFICSGRSPRSATTRPVTLAPVASLARDTAASSAAPGAGSGATALGRIATIGVPRLTRECTIVAPPKMDCSATGFPSSPSVRSTASVSTPESVLTAARQAISLPSAVPASRTSAGDFSWTSWASSAAVGADEHSRRRPDRRRHRRGPRRTPRSAPRPSSAPGPVHTTEGSPNLRASVISSQVTFHISARVLREHQDLSHAVSSRSFGFRPGREFLTRIPRGKYMNKI